MLDVGDHAGRLVEFFDQPLHHLHAAFRSRHHQAVGPGIRIDADVREYPRNDLHSLATGLGKQLEHRTADVSQLLRRLGTASTASAKTSHTRSRRLTRRIDHALDRQVDRFRQLLGNRMFELEDSELVHRIGTVEIDPLDQCRHFLQIPRPSLDDNRIRADVWVDDHPSRQSHTILTLFVNVLEHRGHLARRSVLQTKDLEFGQRVDRTIQLNRQVGDRLKVSARCQDQDRVGLDQRNHRHRLAALARLSPRRVQSLVDRSQ